MVDLQFNIPRDVSFSQAIAITQDILTAPSEAVDPLLTSAITSLLQTPNGARGFFVSFLSGNSALADNPSPAIISALRAVPEPVADLMTKNLAMSTAMELTHQANGDDAQAAGSARIKARSQQLIQQLQLPELQRQLRAMQASTRDQVGEYQDFLTRWGYDEQQCQAIHQTVATLL